MDTLKQMNLAMQYIESHLTDEVDYKELSKKLDYKSEIWIPIKKRTGII